MSLKNNKEVFSEVIVGLFMVAVLGLLVYFTIIISGIDVLNGKSKVPVTVRFHDVGGLKVRDSVILRGMTVGSVNDMR
ncbi:MAG: MlaD family protein, partial [Kiritimatiellae bacterium]|nr:MlaD family protein [Kiritimatiellia bacterium]